MDRLLASPHYGERWGRHWLDVARYADTNGAGRELAFTPTPGATATTSSAPSTRTSRTTSSSSSSSPATCCRPPTRTRRDRNWIATGFLAVGPKTLLANDAVKMELDIVDEQIDTIGRAFLGLTLGCARCHDHKFDPISAADYYALAGIFKSTTTIDNYDLQIDRSWTERALGSDRTKERHQRLKAEHDRANDLRRLSDDSVSSESTSPR